MTIGANSYGSTAGVAAYTSAYTNSGAYDATTQPTLTQVEGWIDEVSGIANTALKSLGFAIPVTQADAKLALQGVVNQQVADLCHAAHSSGRFFSERALNSRLSSMGMIRNELVDFVQMNAAGWEALGAGRASSEKDEIGFRDTDNRGNKTFPLFQRDAFGNRDQDWDS